MLWITENANVAAAGSGERWITVESAEALKQALAGSTRGATLEAGGV